MLKRLLLMIDPASGTPTFESFRNAAKEHVFVIEVLHLCARTGLTPCHLCTRTGLAPCHICARTGPTPATSAPGLGPPLPHLHQDWVHPCHSCTRTGLAPTAKESAVMIGMRRSGNTPKCEWPKRECA
jgi:hypothetical protein